MWRTGGSESSNPRPRLTQRDDLPAEDAEAPHVRLVGEDAHVEGLRRHPSDRQRSLLAPRLSGEVKGGERQEGGGDECRRKTDDVEENRERRRIKRGVVDDVGERKEGRRIVKGGRRD